MKKLMCLTAAMLAGSVLAIESANIVGYQNVSVPYNKSLITPTFKNVDGGKLDLLDIVPLNSDGEMFTKGMSTQCNGKISIQKLTPETGRYATLYAYFYPGSGTKVGWCTGAGVPIQRGDVTFDNGEAMLVANTWKSGQNVFFRCSGEVDLLGQNAVPYNKSLTGNALPVELDLTDIRVLNNEKQDFVKGMSTQCNGKVSIQKLDPATGRYTTLYAWFYPGSGTKVGWCTGAGVPVKKGEVTFAPGEAMLVANTWKSGQVVYFDLPDPTATAAE